MIKDIMKRNACAEAGQREMDALRRHFPQCFTADGAFDIEAFKAALSGGTTLTDETSGFNWLGKNYARMLANMDTTTLIQPDEEHNSKPENRDSENGTIGMERIRRAAKKIHEANPLFSGDLGFKHYTLVEPKKDALLQMEMFDPGLTTATPLTVDDCGLSTVLATWLEADGYGLTAEAEEVRLGRYTAYFNGDHLYFVQPDDDFDADSLVALLDRYNGTAFSPHNIVIFGYSFGFNRREELQKNLRTLREGNKTLNVNIDVRY